MSKRFRRDDKLHFLHLKAANDFGCLQLGQTVETPNEASCSSRFLAAFLCLSTEHLLQFWAVGHFLRPQLHIFTTKPPLNMNNGWQGPLTKLNILVD